MPRVRKQNGGHFTGGPQMVTPSGSIREIAEAQLRAAVWLMYQLGVPAKEIQGMIAEAFGTRQSFPAGTVPATTTTTSGKRAAAE